MSRHRPAIVRAGIGSSLALLATVLTNTLQVRAMRDRAKELADIVHGVDHLAGDPGDTLPLRVTVLGDSAARGFAIPDPADTFSGRLAAGVVAGGWNRAVAVTCHAVDGARTVDILHDQLPQLDRDSDLVVVGVGVNDGLKLTRRRPLVAATRSLISAIRTTAPHARLALMTCPDLQAAPGFPWPFNLIIGIRLRRVARIQRRLLKGYPDVIHVDLQAAMPEHIGIDGFHPGPVGQAAMADHVIRDVFGDSA